MANQGQYRAVVEDLMKQRNQLQFRIGEIDTALSALRRIMPEEAPPPPIAKQTSFNVGGGKYSGMSVRWAVLNLLAEDASRKMATGEVAAALQSGGVTTNGKNFTANVSAVLSEMSRFKEEISSSPDGFEITPKGKEAWIHIKASRERRQDAASIEQELLSVQ